MSGRIYGMTGEHPFLRILKAYGAQRAIEILTEQKTVTRLQLEIATGVSPQQSVNVLDTLWKMRVLTRGQVYRANGYRPYAYGRGPLFDEALEIVERVNKIEQSIRDYRMDRKRPEPKLVNNLAQQA